MLGYSGRRAAVTALALLGLLLSGCDSDTPKASSSPTPSPTPSPAGTDLYFYPPVEGAKLEYTNSGAISGTMKITVREVTGGDARTVTVEEVNDGSGTPVTVERGFVTGPDGGLSIDAGVFAASAPGISVQAAGDDVRIPPIAELEAGKSATGKTSVTYSAAGVKGRTEVTYTATGGGFEPVTVPAGSVEAYTVKLDLTFGTGIAGITGGTARFWFRPGFGLVKQETSVGGLTLRTELTSTTVPLA